MNRRYDSRWLILLLIFAIVIPHGMISNIEQVLAAQTGTVTANTLNVRSEPSSTAEKVQLNGSNVYLIKGETVNILQVEGDFYNVSLKFNGKTVKGYVHKDFVSVAEEVKPTAAPTATPKPATTPKPIATPKPGSTDMVPVAKAVELKASVTASSLNVRSGPGTNYSKVTGLVKGDSITVISKTVVGKEEWYGLSVPVDGVTKTGYALSSYIKLSFSKSIKGEIDATKLKIRSVAGSTAAYLKDKSKNIISLKEGKDLTIIEETTLSGVKWFKVTFTLSKKKYTGFAEASQVRFLATVVQPTSKPTPKPTTKPTTKPTPKPTPTPTPKPSAIPTLVATITPMPSITPTPSIAVSPTPSPMPAGQSYLQVPNNSIITYISQPTSGYVCNTNELYIVRNLASFENLLDNNNLPITLTNSQQVLINEVVTIDNIPWYGVSLDSGIYGYVKGEYIYVGNQLPTGSTVVVPITTTPITPTPPTPITPTPIITNNLDFESKLTAEGFPESYKAYLRSLHMQYPNWEFKAYHTGLDWNTVITAESVPAKNLLSNAKSIEWKSLESRAYDWKTDAFNVFDGSTWVTASKAAIEYYMDPRNFLTVNGIFQFELLKYQSSYQNLNGVENILKGTAMYNSYYTYTDDSGVTQSISYAQTFIKAAEYSGVSPYHLASRVKQEVVTGPTTLSNSVSGTYSGYEGLYNFYNIGANDSAGGGAVANGLRYAKNGTTNAVTNSLYMIPWTSPYRSLVGGSYFLGGSYINRGQDTIYLQKFNVTPISTYYHQYMTNVEAPFAEGKKVLTAYNGMSDSPIIFSIPIYLNMPASAAPQPTTMFNPNNRMKSLKVLDMGGNELAITPTFDQTVNSYYLIVPNTVEVVQINATTVSKKATISGGGMIPLNVGNNTIILSVIAENGTIANYTVNIVRE